MIKEYSIATVSENIILYHCTSGTLPENLRAEASLEIPSAPKSIITNRLIGRSQRCHEASQRLAFGSRSDESSSLGTALYRFLDAPNTIWEGICGTRNDCNS